MLQPFIDPQVNLKTTLNPLLIDLNDFGNSGPKNPFLVTAIGDFNTSKNWYNKGKTSFEGNTAENTYSLH